MMIVRDESLVVSSSVEELLREHVTSQLAMRENGIGELRTIVRRATLFARESWVPGRGPVVPGPGVSSTELSSVVLSAAC